MVTTTSMTTKGQRSVSKLEGQRSIMFEEPLKGEESAKSISIGIHRPNKNFQVTEQDFNLDKYADLELNEIYLDPRPRIKNIVKELQEEHQWTWPPQPPKDFEKLRLKKRKKWPALYNSQCLDLCTFLSLIIGPWELLVAIGYMTLPKTFVPAMRESSEFSILFSAIFIIEGIFHTYAALLGLGLRSMRPYMIGFVFPSWPFEFVLPLLGIFSTFIAFYTTQKWRIVKEMTTHLKGYNHRWYSKAYWDRYQSFMHCCGIDGFDDWKHHGPVLENPDGNISIVPHSCCIEENCWMNTTESNVHSMGCLDVTKMGTNTIFISATFCMLIALFLSVMGYRSMREAEDFMGDPCHKLIFDTNSTNSLKTTNRALRREELFGLLNVHSLYLGEELGFTKEVNDVKDFLGILSDKNESQKKDPKITLFAKQETGGDSNEKPPKKDDDLPPPGSPSEPGGEASPDFLFEMDTGPQGSKTDLSSEQPKDNSKKDDVIASDKSEKLFQPDHVDNLSDVESKKSETDEMVPWDELSENSIRHERVVQKWKDAVKKLLALESDNSSLQGETKEVSLSPSAMEYAIPPEPEQQSVTQVQDDDIPTGSKKEPLVDLIPSVPSEMTRVNLLDPIQSPEADVSRVESNGQYAGSVERFSNPDDIVNAQNN